jgi:hypothetical protein
MVGRAGLEIILPGPFSKEDSMICYICPGEPVKMLCTKKHRPGHNCKKHEVPKNAIWQGEWPEEEFGDLKADVKHQRKEHRKKFAKELRVLWNLQRIRVAAAFLEYHRSIVEKHKASMTGFQFQPRNRGPHERNN